MATEYATDKVGEEVYSAHHTVVRVLSSTVACLMVIALWQQWRIQQLASRPPVSHYLRLSDAGSAVPIAYSDLKFTPTEGMARTYLTNWAKYRYTVLRDSFAKSYSKNYIFMATDLAAREMSKDVHARLIARVTEGQTEQNDLIVENPIILTFQTEETKHGTVARGTAIITMVKIFSAELSTMPRREHWEVAAQFILDPWQVYEKTKVDPAYEQENPLGLAISSYHENHSRD